MAITIKDIAKLAGVSYGTVSRVLNDRPGVNPKTKEQVLRVIDEVGYKPNAIARSLVTKQSKSIALIVPDISQPFFGEIALSVDRETFKRGYNTILCNTNFDMEIEKRKLQFVHEKRVDGIIIRPAREDSRQYREMDVPTVLISHTDDKFLNYIDIKNFEGGYIAGEHLGECGYKNVAYIGGYKEEYLTQERLKGFRAALEENGLELKESMMRFGDLSIKTGYNGFADLLEAGTMPDAVFCANDQIALGVMHKAEEKGIKVPDQLGVVGFDNEVMTSFPQINLTTISQPADVMGKLAAQILIEKLENPENDKPIKKLIAPELILRGTTKRL